ncbi:MAG: hypothetical protein KBA28_15525 [Syntrophaceae bacterium]|nr:hypothetical protein [Syntrophaceae bacterium]
MNEKPPNTAFSETANIFGEERRDLEGWFCVFSGISLKITENPATD